MNRPKTIRLVLLVWFALGLGLGGQGQPIRTQAATPGTATDTATGASSPRQSGNSTVAQWRAKLARLGDTNTPGADVEMSAWLDRLLAGQVAKEIQFEVLEAAAKHSSAVIKEKIAKYRAARVEEGGLAPLSELLYGGNAELGKKIFFEKVEAQCTKCHKVGQVGGETGPSLTITATNRTREFILESIVYPSAKITPGYETAIIVLKDRTGYNGIIKSENETELKIDCDPDGISTIRKSEIASRRKGPSPMPEGLPKNLTDRDLRDLIEFVASLTTNTEIATDRLAQTAP